MPLPATKRIGDIPIMEETKMSEQFRMGWLPDYPDFRDCTVDHASVLPRPKELGQKDSITAMLAKAGVAKTAKAGLPVTADLRPWCPAGRILALRDCGFR
jgi:hypothetical protein